MTCAMHYSLAWQGQYSPTLGSVEYVLQPAFDEDFSLHDCPFKCPMPFFGNNTGNISNSVPCLSTEPGCCTQDAPDWPQCNQGTGPGEGRRKSVLPLAGMLQLDSRCSGPCPEVLTPCPMSRGV